MAPLLLAMVHFMLDVIVLPLLQHHLTPMLRVMRKMNPSLIPFYSHHKTSEQPRLSHPRYVFCPSCVVMSWILLKASTISSSTPGEELLPPSVVPLTPLPLNGHKHSADDTFEESAPTTHPKPSRKTSSGQAITQVALSVLALASAFSSSGVSTSPEQKWLAIQLLEDDGDLSDNEHIRAMKLIHCDISVADVLLAVGSKERRTHYIQSELEDL